MNNPLTRLAMAVLLVAAEPEGANGTDGRVPEPAPACAPHLRQNWSWSSMLLPQRMQNVLIHFSRRARRHIKICTKHTLRSRVRQCATLVPSFVPDTSVWYVAAMEQPAVSLKPCPDCAAQMPQSAAFCPGCGRSMQVESASKQKLGILRENLAGALAYITFLPAVVFLLLDPYRRNPFVRFHSVQCLLFWLANVVVAVLLRLAVRVLLFIPIVGPLLALLMVVIVALAAVFTWIVLLVKAFQGERFGLPVVGNLAERYAGAA